MRSIVLSLALVSSSLCAAPLHALDCRVSGRPAATLLFPYFEVDLANPAGATTLLSIGNAGTGPALANVVLWTDCGFPALSFPVYLAGDAVQSLNLRLVLSGQLPVTGADGGESFPDCSDPLELPELDGEALTILRARLAGEPDPDDGLCYGSHRPGSQIAKGYLTVDAVSACSESVRTPLDDGYFAAGGTGLATNDNVLWGDFFLVDGEGDAAQGEAAVGLVADSEYYAGHPGVASFYDDDDERYPLGSSYRTRFLRGGAFDGGTEVIAWLERGPFSPPVPDTCEFACQFAATGTVTERDESGVLVDHYFPEYPGLTSRIAVGSEDLPVASSFGTLEVFSYSGCSVCSAPIFPVQSWVMPIHTAEGRFSVGLPAVQLANPCVD